MGDEMYLKEMRAHGFKSFADKVTIEFGNCISGIVGPNGSGKSNVVDAVRWVLGEQSVKSLRGDGTMTDVIFSGSKSRNAQNVATVTLIFDNRDHYLPVEFTEVAIQRRVYKDGTNEYLLNGEKCRLKDIADILMDTGVAKESFNIISQGKIEEIISHKPADRRVIFEEAAGVLKYKTRKGEALRKLDRTHENMRRVDDIIEELRVQVEPLLEQKEKAILYQTVSETLKNTEIALIVSDITTLSHQDQISKARIATLNEEILNINSQSRTNEAEISKVKVELDGLERKYNETQKTWIEKTTELEKINSQKQILLERKKYEVEDQKLHTSMVLLKERELKLTSDCHRLKEELELRKRDLSCAMNERKDLDCSLEQVRTEKQQLEGKLTNLIRAQSMMEHRIDQLKDNLEHNSSLPYAVKSVLDHPNLTGVHHVIGQLFEVDEAYATAISTALGGASNYVVVDNEMVAKNCIRYLKDNTLGRATFFPLNVIKKRVVDSSVLKRLEQLPGFVAMASDLIKYQPVYDDIMKNQLGTVVVARTIDEANQISKTMNGYYKIVTLDGELIHVGGSITGGKAKKTGSIINDKFELEKCLKDHTLATKEIEKIEDQMNEKDHTLKSVEDKLYLIQKEIVTCEGNYRQNKEQLDTLIQDLEQISLEKKGTSNILNDSLTSEEDHILKLYYQTVEQKEDLERNLNLIKREKNSVTEQLGEIEFSYKKENSILDQLSKELKTLEIESNRTDVKLDTLLTNLSETYAMTYEKAVTLYTLEEEVEVARGKVQKMKQQIRALGTVNLGAILEYDRVSTRFKFLESQKEDLIKAEDMLLEIIKEMDEVMEKEFTETFEMIRKNFTETFRELFRGGSADLKLTDPEHLLETGIEIVASPPGKKLSSISLLSGGEKTFTAISLLFAILKSRPVPFCILDEVEAALDETNVDSFGKYIEKLKEKTQFILITHKKKTMEYADILYGITMQESGVSKLVSVKLEEIEPSLKNEENKNDR